MISRNQRIEAFTRLGNFINDPAHKYVIEDWAHRAYSKNNWFTPFNATSSLKAIACEFLAEDKLSEWAAKYSEPAQSKAVGVVMAGNIPAVGFHDALCTLISGHTLMAKLSSEDGVLIRLLLDKLVEIEPLFEPKIKFVERLNEADSFIATGSDNTARYFHYYFSNKPHIIRKNRTSVAVLTGEESGAQLTALGNDILQYFGLGCRNVSRLFVPEGYDFTQLYQAVEPLAERYLHHHKYFNNYEYNKSIVLINRLSHVDNGFLIITENEGLVSPISVLHYATYQSVDDVKSEIDANREKIQCVVASPQTGISNVVNFGESQTPGLADYADDVDTMAFLEKL